ncbi:MAG: hypothetical protein AAGH41_09245 [Pseudomonadota bacterium]
MRISAFSPSLDFSAPSPAEVIEEEDDDRLSPEEVAVLIDRAADAARAEGYDKGFREGSAQEKDSIAARLEEEVLGLRAAIDSVRGQEEELFDDLETRTARLLLALIHQLARQLSESEAKRLAENVTMRAVEAVRGKHRISIRAESAVLEPLRAVLRLPTDEEAAAHRIEFQPAEDGAGAPLEVAWLTGKVTFDPYAFTGAIDEIFTETLKSLSGDEGPLLRDGESE